MSLRVVRRKGSKTLYIRGTVRGHRIFEAAGTAEKDLAEALRSKRETQLFEEAIIGKRVAVSFRRAALSYLEFEERNKRIEGDVHRLVAHFADTTLAKIDQLAADAAVRAMLQRDAAPATRRRAVYAPLTAVLNHAHRRGWCERPGFELPSLPRGKTRWLSPAEALLMLAAAAGHLEPILHFILCTGARVSEALGLDWADVDLPAAKVIFRDTKNGDDRVASLPEAAIVTLANMPGEEVAPGQWAKRGKVFRRDDGKPYANQEKLYGGQLKTAFRSALKRAGIKTPTRPHDLRHTFATWFYALSKDPLLLKVEGGWKSLQMIERYAHLMGSEMVPEISRVWGAAHPRIGALPRAPAVHQKKTVDKTMETL